MRIHAVLGFALVTAVVTMAGATAAPPVQPVAPRFQPRFPYPGPMHEVYGVVRAVNGTMLSVQTRHGLISVDTSWAAPAGTVAPVFVSRSVIVHGVLVKNGLIAHDVMRNNFRDPAMWPADR
jgi:hypothetical protein